MNLIKRLLTTSLLVLFIACGNESVVMPVSVQLTPNIQSAIELNVAEKVVKIPAVTPTPAVTLTPAVTPLSKGYKDTYNIAAVLATEFAKSQCVFFEGIVDGNQLIYIQEYKVTENINPVIISENFSKYWVFIDYSPTKSSSLDAIRIEKITEFFTKNDGKNLPKHTTYIYDASSYSREAEFVVDLNDKTVQLNNGFCYIDQLDFTNTLIPTTGSNNLTTEPTTTATSVPPTAIPVPAATPAPTATAVPLELGAICSFDTSVPKISCQSSGTTQGSELQWESNVSGWQTGHTFEVQLIEAHQLVPQVVVTLKECQGSNCQTVEILLDTSSIVPVPPTVTPVPAATPAPTTTLAPTAQNDDHPGLVGCIEKDFPVFTHHVANLESVSGVYPNIVTSGNWLKPNTYIWIDHDTPVYAPADATSVGLLRWVQTYQDESGFPQERNQFTVELQISCEIRINFQHLEELAEPFNSLAGTKVAINNTHMQNFVYLQMEVKAGTLLGYARDNDLSGAADGFDFVINNSEKFNQFANQERYQVQGDLKNLLNTDCPFDYYSPSMRKEWAAKFGYENIRLAGYDCDMGPDVKGTIAGGWFQSPHDPATDGKTIIDWGLAIRVKSDGHLNIGHPNGTLKVDSADPTFQDPKTVFYATCFYDSSSNQFGYLEPIGDMEMKAAFGNGTCPSEMPSASQIFYR